MTACQIVEEIEAAGGVLRLEGDRVRCNIPTSARALVEVARAHREGIREVLRQRLEGARPVVLGWVATRCAKAPGAWSAERFLYRDYRKWCFAEGHAAVGVETFTAILNDGFARAGDGWCGLCLGVDFFAGFPGAERCQRGSAAVNRQPK
jgi:hypothetical protein